MRRSKSGPAPQGSSKPVPSWPRLSAMRRGGMGWDSLADLMYVRPRTDDAVITTIDSIVRVVPLMIAAIDLSFREELRKCVRKV
jgi:hypothetical protein